MPNVNGQQFPYTPEGVAQAAQAAEGGFNPDQNPFEAILAEAQSQPMTQGAMPQAPAPQAPAPQGGAAVPEEEMGPEELQPGKTGDNTRPLLTAVQALHNYIAASTDPGTIQLVRNLISALTQLVARDQKASEQMAQQQTGQAAGQAAPGPAAAPQGQPMPA